MGRASYLFLLEVVAIHFVKWFPGTLEVGDGIGLVWNTVFKGTMVILVLFVTGSKLFTGVILNCGDEFKR